MDRGTGRWCRHHPGLLLIGVLCAALLGTGCDSDLHNAVTEAPTLTPAPDTYQGTITSVGSSVLAPLINRAAVEFHTLAPDAFVLPITSTSLLGLAVLQDDGADIAMSDVSAVDLLGAEADRLSEYRIAVVPYAVIANPNAGVHDLSQEQLRKIYSGEVRNWKDVGGFNVPITPFHASKGQGLRHLFTRRLLNNADSSIVATTSSNLVRDVRRNRGGIGYTPLNAVTPGAEVIALDGVLPSQASIVARRYPFWSYASMYTNGTAGGLAHVFISYLLSPNIQKDTIPALGFIPIGLMEEQRTP